MPKLANFSSTIALFRDIFLLFLFACRCGCLENAGINGCIEVNECLLNVVNSNFSFITPCCNDRASTESSQSIYCSPMRNALISDYWFGRSLIHLIDNILFVILRVVLRHIVIVEGLYHFTPLHNVNLILSLVNTLTTTAEVDTHWEFVVVVLSNTQFLIHMAAIVIQLIKRRFLKPVLEAHWLVCFWAPLPHKYVNGQARPLDL